MTEQRERLTAEEVRSLVREHVDRQVLTATLALVLSREDEAVGRRLYDVFTDVRSMKAPLQVVETYVAVADDIFAHALQMAADIRRARL